MFSMISSKRVSGVSVARVTNFPEITTMQCNLSTTTKMNLATVGPNSHTLRTSIAGAVYLVDCKVMPWSARQV